MEEGQHFYLVELVDDRTYVKNAIKEEKCSLKPWLLQASNSRNGGDDKPRVTKVPVLSNPVLSGTYPRALTDIGTSNQSPITPIAIAQHQKQEVGIKNECVMTYLAA